MHLCQGLATNTATAFPVNLLMREVDCSAGQYPFLENPSSLVEVPFQDMMVEVVHEFTNIERGSPGIWLKTDVFTCGTALQEPVILPSCRSRRQYTVSPTENVFHTLRLMVKIALGSLDDADRVDP